MIDPNSGYRIITYKLINKPSAEKSASANARIACRERLHHAQEEKGRPSIGEFQRLREKLRTDGAFEGIVAAVFIGALQFMQLAPIKSSKP